MINNDFLINSSDFLRETIRDKLKEYEIIEIRELPYTEARKEILNFCEKS